MSIAKRALDKQTERPVRAPTVAEIAAARVRLEGLVQTTPVLSPAALEVALGTRILLKCEQFQTIGAFKARGATNAVRSLTPAELAHGVATHSSGNHGAALAWAARAAGAHAAIVVPTTAVETKREAIRRFGGEIVDCGPTQADREAMLAEVTAARGAIVIHPYDDARVIAGQATATIELLEAEPRLERLLVPIGGGGLAAGAILAARALGRRVKIIGVEPAGADDTRRSLAAGKRVSLARVDTVADGLRAQVGLATFPVLREGLADLVTVEDADILNAVRFALEHVKLVIEPSGATVLAALMSGAVSPGPGLTGAIISGGNMDFGGEVFKRVFAPPSGV